MKTFATTGLVVGLLLVTAGPGAEERTGRGTLPLTGQPPTLTAPTAGAVCPCGCKTPGCPTQVACPLRQCPMPTTTPKPIPMPTPMPLPTLEPTPTPRPTPTPVQPTTPPVGPAPQPPTYEPTPTPPPERRVTPTVPGTQIIPRSTPQTVVPVAPPAPTATDEQIRQLGTTIKGQEGSCCCCVKDIKVAIALPDKQIMTIRGREYDYTHLGHVLTTTIDLDYQNWNNEAFGDCILQWWEKTDHEKSLVDGQRVNEWIDKSAHRETKGSFDKSWGARKRPCPGKETVPTDVDPPGFGARYPFERDKVTDKRTLDIAIRVLSAPGCPCTLTEKVIYLRQYLELKGGKMTTQTMRELQPEHFQGNPPQPWKK